MLRSVPAVLIVCATLLCAASSSHAVLLALTQSATMDCIRGGCDSSSYISEDRNPLRFPVNISDASGAGGGVIGSSTTRHLLVHTLAAPIKVAVTCAYDGSYPQWTPTAFIQLFKAQRSANGTWPLPYTKSCSAYDMSCTLHGAGSVLLSNITILAPPGSTNNKHAQIVELKGPVAMGIFMNAAASQNPFASSFSIACTVNRA